MQKRWMRETYLNSKVLKRKGGEICIITKAGELLPGVENECENKERLVTVVPALLNPLYHLVTNLGLGVFSEL